MSAFKKTFFILLILAGFPFYCAAFEPFQKEIPGDPTTEIDNPDDFINQFLFSNLPVLMLDENNIPVYTTLEQWLVNNKKKAVILIINRLWPDAFAQIAPFERLSRSYAGNSILFAVVYIHRKPSAYLNYVNKALQSQYLQFTADIRSFDSVFLDFSRPLFLFTDYKDGILFSKHDYLSLKKFQAYLEMFDKTGLTQKGDSP